MALSILILNLKGQRMEIFLDIETDNLFPQLTRIDLIGILYKENIYVRFREIEEFKKFIRNRELEGKKIRFIGHNIINFDSLVLKKFFADPYFDKYWDNCVDTLLLSRLLFPELEEHSLKFWGKYFGLDKLSLKGTKLTKYNKRDLEITKLLYNNLKLKIVPALKPCLRLEHKFAVAVRDQILNGFCYDEQRTKEFKEDLEADVLRLSLKIQEQMLDLGKLDETGIPNPKSRQQLIKFFIEKYNWEPKEFTAKGSPKISKEILEDLPYKEAKLIVKMFNLNSKLATIKKWFVYAGYTGRVHGGVNTLGAITGRCTHQNPNMANISRDKRMRGCWVPRSDNLYLGSVDFQAQEVRCLAHFLTQFDKGEFAAIIGSGQFDIHSINQEHLGFKYRQTAKNFLYAFVYGATQERLARVIIDSEPYSLREALKFIGDKVRLFEKLYPNIPRVQRYYRNAYQQNGFILGLDGRILKPQKTYSGGSIMNCLIQNAGAVLMKQAMVNLRENVPEIKIVANVHDEIVFEIRKDLVEDLREIIREFVISAGQPYNFKCKLDAEVKVGNNWAEVH